jgi:3-keto-5-aminohexanoate cleavage enzyme
MQDMEKLIITAAITGSRTPKEKSPYIPITPEEIANSAIEAVKAGAAIVHIHVRDLNTKLGTQDKKLYQQVLDKIYSEVNPVVCLTTSGIPGKNLGYEERFIPLQFRTELASFDAGSINVNDGVFLNPPDFLKQLALKMKEYNVKPELEVFDTGMIEYCKYLANEGLLKEPLHFQFVLGVRGGASANLKTLLHMVEIIPEDSTWSVIGIGKGQLPMVMAGMILGGHVRVGLEDNIYYTKGRLAKSNAELVERVVRIACEYGREIASPEEARKILSIN